MNSIRQIQSLNKRELENAVPPEASWHADYRDTAYIYIGGLPYDLSEGDVVTIFSQYGEPVHVNLVRDKETGKSRGFAFLKYEDQRSTDLAVDNLGGATVLGRMLRVDHVRYKRRDDEEEGDNVARLMGDTDNKNAGDGDTDDERRRRKKRRTSDDEPRRRPLLKEEKELEELIRNHDDEDPMKEFLIEEKKEEVTQALERLEREEKSSKRRDHSRESLVSLKMR
ncbi:U2 snRNP component IST3 [Aspergillus terreus]|nr:U2 snRNP component IST3 [Aspergillus terreus]